MALENTKISLELALIINHEAIGPSFCAATFSELSDVSQQQMFASRVILTAGIGEQLLTSGRLHGPIEVIEVKDDKYNMVFYPFHHMIPGREMKGYGEIRRVSILTIFYKEKINHEILPLLPFMEKQLRLILESTNIEELLQTVENIEASHCKDLEDALKHIKNELEYRIALRYEGITRGASIFDLAVISKLPKPYKKIALVLIQNPDGWELESLKEKISEMENVEKALRDLIFMGFLTEKEGRFIPV